MKIFLIIIFLLFFLPIPIMFSMYYNKEDYYIKLYKFVLISKQKENKVANNEKEKNVTAQIDKKEKSKKRKNKDNKKFFKKHINPTSLIMTLNNNKFKPRLRLNGSLYYSLNDAAHTAILYGVISAICPVILKFIKIFFKTKNFKFPIIPQFTDKFLVRIEIKSIIFLSLGQIIYMLFLLFKKSNIHKGGETQAGKL